MRTSDRRPAGAAILVIVALGVALAACASGPAPSTASPVTSSPVPSSPSDAPDATATPSSTASAGADACAIEPQVGALPSDRMVEIRVDTSEAADRVTFVFDDSSLPGPAGIPEGRLEAAEPPYTEGASGLPIDIEGDHVVLIRFDQMSLSNDVGQPTYDGPFEFTPELPALQHVALYEMFEGIVGWYVGYDGPGCVTLASDGGNVTLTIAHE